MYFLLALVVIAASTTPTIKNQTKQNDLVKVLLKMPVVTDDTRIIDISTGITNTMYVEGDWLVSQEAFNTVIIGDKSTVVVELNRGNGPKVPLELSQCLSWLHGEIQFGDLTQLEAYVLSFMRRLYSHHGAVDELVCEELVRVFQSANTNLNINDILRLVEQGKLFR
jgi:hypothetical protein